MGAADESIFLPPRWGLTNGVAIVTGVSFGCASLHPCLNSIAPTGLRKTTRNEGGITDMPRHVPTVGRRLEKNNELHELIQLGMRNYEL